MDAIKKIEKLLKISKRISFDELTILSEENEDKVISIVKELEQQKIIKISNDLIIYFGFQKKLGEKKENLKNEKQENIDKFEQYNNTEIPDWAKKRLSIYKKMFEDSNGLINHSNKLKFFIEKYCNVNNLEIMTQNSFINLKKNFLKKEKKIF